MSITNRPPPPTAMQTRFGFIPRPAVPGSQQVRPTTYAARSRSISPTSHLSGNSSSTSSISSQRLARTAQTTSKAASATTTTNNSKPKTVISPRQTDSSTSKSNVKSNTFMRSRTPSRTSITSSSSSINSPPNPPPSSIPPPSSSSISTAAHTEPTIKADVNAIRDRYRTQKRMNFFTRHVPLSTANGSPIAGSDKENKRSSPTTNTVKKKKRMNFIIK